MGDEALPLPGPGAAAARPDFDITTRWVLEARPEELSAVILEPETLDAWAGAIFLACEVVERGRPDGLGLTIRVHTKGFLPHTFFFGGAVREVVPNRRLVFDVDGDFVGRGAMEVTTAGTGRLVASFHWQVDVAHPWVRRFVRPLHPVFVLNHRFAMRRLSALIQREVHRRRAGRNAIDRSVPTFPHNLAAYRRWQRRSISARGWARFSG